MQAYVKPQPTKKIPILDDIKIIGINGFDSLIENGEND
jgi:hypothetical protein